MSKCTFSFSAKLNKSKLQEIQGQCFYENAGAHSSSLQCFHFCTCVCMSVCACALLVFSFQLAKDEPFTSNYITCMLPSLILQLKSASRSPVRVPCVQFVIGFHICVCICLFMQCAAKGWTSASI